MNKFTRLGVRPMIRVDTFLRDFVPVQRDEEIDRHTRYGDDLFQQFQQRTHGGLYGRLWRLQRMSPPTAVGNVPQAHVCGIGRLDLPDSLDRSAEPQHVAIVRLCGCPPIKMVTPRIMPKRRVTGGVWHSVLNMHVLMSRASIVVY
ncbi:MAG TPA: hypothetical protein VGM53_14730 [Streptosporangiaceae bacterium]